MIKVIIVDDEIHCQDTLSILLTEYCPGLRIVERCNSGKSALLAIHKHEPELVFLDIEMQRKFMPKRVLQSGMQQ